MHRYKLLPRTYTHVCIYIYIYTYIYIYMNHNHIPLRHCCNFCCVVVVAVDWNSFCLCMYVCLHTCGLYDVHKHMICMYAACMHDLHKCMNCMYAVHTHALHKYTIYTYKCNNSMLKIHTKTHAYIHAQIHACRCIVPLSTALPLRSKSNGPES